MWIIPAKTSVTIPTNSLAAFYYKHVPAKQYGKIKSIAGGMPVNTGYFGDHCATHFGHVVPVVSVLIVPV